MLRQLPILAALVWIAGCQSEKLPEVDEIESLVMLRTDFKNVKLELGGEVSSHKEYHGDAIGADGMPYFFSVDVAPDAIYWRATRQPRPFTKDVVEELVMHKLGLSKTIMQEKEAGVFVGSGTDNNGKTTTFEATDTTLNIVSEDHGLLITAHEQEGQIDKIRFCSDFLQLTGKLDR